MKKKIQKYKKTSDYKNVFGIGIELFCGFLISFAVSWGIGIIFGFSMPVKIIIGFILGISHNFLTLYRLSKK